MNKGTKRLIGLVAAVSLLMTILTGVVASASTGTVNKNLVNFRAKPSTSAKIISTVKKGTKLTLMGKTGSWYKAKIAGKVGYMSATFVTKTVIKPKAGVIVVSVANVRKAASKASKVLTQVKQGDAVSVYSTTKKWYKIKTKNATMGYIMKSFVKLKTTTTSRGDTSRPTKGQLVVNYAKQFIGTRYNYAHASPSEGFDCSGLVWYAYKHFGVSVNRSSSGLTNDGTPVSKTALKVGDILLFQRGGHIFHAALYIGNGKMLHAEPDDGVNIDTLMDNGYYEARFVKAVRIYN